jgi:hypothetical protein
MADEPSGDVSNWPFFNTLNKAPRAKEISQLPYPSREGLFSHNGKGIPMHMQMQWMMITIKPRTALGGTGSRM